jgi:hypothetical protein
MTENEYAVVLVHSTSYALRAEKVLAAAGIDCKLIPVPRRLSSNCGVCVRVERIDQAATREALEKADVEIKGMYAV